MAFFASTTKENYYKIDKISKGITTNGKHYAFIKINTKNGKEFINATINLWMPVSASVGDFVAFFDVNKIWYEVKEYQNKKYYNLMIQPNSIKIKTAEEYQKFKESQEQKNENTKEQTQTQNENPKPQAYQEQSVGLAPIDDDNLPF